MGDPTTLSWVEKPDSKATQCDSIYRMFKKRQNYRVRKSISGYQGPGVGGIDWLQRGLGEFLQWWKYYVYLGGGYEVLHICQIHRTEYFKRVNFTVSINPYTVC